MQIHLWNKSFIIKALKYKVYPTKQVLYLESTLCEMQSQNLITMNTSDLLKLEMDKLKQ